MSRIIRFVYSATLIVFLASMFFLVVAAPRLRGAERTLRVSFLNVGQGDAILIETPEKSRVLVDAGRDGSVVRELDRIIPWWDRRIDYAILTHPDSDHYAGFGDVVRTYQIGEFLWTGDSDDGILFQDVFKELSSRSLRLRRVAQGDGIRWPSGVSLEVLWPPSAYVPAEKNEGSLVVLVRYGMEEYLLTGDLPLRQEDQLVQRYPDIDVEVLKAGHHGSKTSSGSAFLEAITPEWCIISAGAANRYGHPHQEALLRLRESGCRIYATATYGAVRMRSSKLETEVYATPVSLSEWARYAILGMFNGPKELGH